MGELQTLLALVVLVYVLCVIVQAIQEVVKSVLDTKATTMEDVIKKALAGHVSVDQLKAALEQRGLNLTNLEQFNKDDFLKLLDGIQLAGQQVMPGVAAAAAANVTQLKDHIAASYEAARTKFQQSYAKKNKAWVIAISFIVVLALNASLIKIYYILSVNQQMSQAIAGTASTVVNASQSNQNTGTPQSQDLAAIFEKNRRAIEADVKKYPVLLRTTEYGEDFKEPLQELGGLLLMGILVSLGAPFWNDVLKGVTGFNNALNSGVKKTP